MTAAGIISYISFQYGTSNMPQENTYLLILDLWVISVECFWSSSNWAFKRSRLAVDTGEPIKSIYALLHQSQKPRFIQT